MFQTKHAHRRTLGAVAFLAAVILVVVTAGGGLGSTGTAIHAVSVGRGVTDLCDPDRDRPTRELNLFEDPLVGPFDGIEDTLVGVVNNSSATE